MENQKETPKGTKIYEIEIKGERYVLKDYHKNKLFIGKNVMVRTLSAGVHMGILEYHDGKEVVLKDSIRIWYWSGAASLSQLVAEGTKKPSECKFTVPIPTILLTEAIEIMPITKSAEENFKAIKPWKQ